MTPTQTNYDSEFCGRIPLHQVNVIQPYAALLVLDKEQLEVVQCSQNTAEILGIPYTEVQGRNIRDLLTPESAGRFDVLKTLATSSDELPETLAFAHKDGSTEVRLLFHNHDHYYLIEAEQIRPVAASSFALVYQELKKSMAMVNAAQTLYDACKIALTELKRLTGFDRLMLYRFDRDWNGVVVAEVKEEEMVAYENLRFPASDIPKSARELYRICRYRYIPDSQYEPVKLHPFINPLTKAFTDLGPCNLRGVAAVHLQYLANMEVRTSLSTRVMLNQQLWGLISCHHRTPKYLTYEEAAIFELISGVIATKILDLERAEYTDQVAGLQKVQTDLMERVLFEKSIPEGLLRQEEDIRRLLGADGVAIISQKKIYTTGKVPDRKAIEELVFWLQLHHTTEVVHFHKLAEHYEPAGEMLDVASGAIVLPIQPEKGEYIIGFRPEKIHEVSWGGNPEEAIQFNADKTRYSPRNSFDIWRQTVRGTSREWSDAELLTATRFRTFIQKFLLREYALRQELA